MSPGKASSIVSRSLPNTRCAAAHPQFFAGSRMQHFHLAAKVPGANPHKGHAVSVARIEIGLDLEDKAGKVLPRAGNRARDRSRDPPAVGRAAKSPAGNARRQSSSVRCQRKRATIPPPETACDPARCRPWQAAPLLRAPFPAAPGRNLRIARARPAGPTGTRSGDRRRARRTGAPSASPCRRRRKNPALRQSANCTEPASMPSLDWISARIASGSWPGTIDFIDKRDHGNLAAARRRETAFRSALPRPWPGR